MLNRVLNFKVDKAQAYQLANYLTPFAQAVWRDYKDPAGKFCISQDVYLKLYAISNPIINVDYILFDEAQDAEPLMLHVLINQKCKLVYVGDPHQQIYDWRGAVNAMQSVECESPYLTRSFRFGAQIADKANALLGYLGEKKPLVGSDVLSEIKRLSFRDTNAILCRTNSGAIEACLEVMNTDRKLSIHLDLTDIYSLKNLIKDIHEFIKNPSQFKDHIILGEFDSYNDLKTYCENPDNDSDISRPFKLYETYEYDALMSVFNNARKVRNPDVTITTVHKSKGMEWDAVTLWSDFENISYKVRKKKITDAITFEASDSEIRLIYVAITRAKLALDIDNILDIFIYIKTADYSPITEML